MPTGSHEHRFNDDLLANDGDQERAQKLYPDVAHVLDHPELRAMFKTYNDAADAAKRRSRTFGYTAIGLATAALLTAALTPLFHDAPLGVLRVVGFLASVAGIAGIAFALNGVLFQKAKAEWLDNRLMTERLRQFHFQTLARRWPDILASLSDDKTRAAYAQKRDTWFTQFRARFEGKLGAELHNALSEEGNGQGWLHPEPAGAPPPEAWAKLQPLFDAYRELRIMHQLGYASFKLHDAGGIGLSTAPAQAALFSNTALICIAVVVGVHLVLAVGMLFGYTALIKADWLHVMAIVFAIVVLAVRALEEGLQPKREIERYRQYASAIRAMRDHFDAATTPDAKLVVMHNMERLVVDEMRNFLRTNDEAKFVM
ncbi:MAG: hypothetical protein F9K29_12765 [Hyphomicrobiaceae bacterium]|nr:MAG: hypothetical protein F9K29_12765 [Hyphomicrobiaceae bacterium]